METHKRYCEEEIFGSDIMPFAVHLTSANLASMEPSVTIEKTEIIQGDSLRLSKGYTYPSGVQLTLFPAARKGYSMSGESHDVHLGKVDVILMNPPFTKVERGIRKYVDMERFGNVNAVGRWKQERCSHIENNYCMYWLWNEKPSVPYQIGEPLQKNGRWHIHPTYARCAACPTYHKQGTTTLQSLELELSELEAGLDGTLFDIRRRFKCSSCGSRRLVAIKIKCTECDSESWWGYHPH